MSYLSLSKFQVAKRGQVSGRKNGPDAVICNLSSVTFLKNDTCTLLNTTEGSI